MHYQITTPAQAGCVQEHDETCHSPRFTLHPPSTIHHLCLVPAIRKQSPLIRKRKPLIRKRKPLIRKRKPLIRERNPLVLDDFAKSQRTCINAGEKKFT